MNYPIISIITVCFNSAKTIAQTLDSVIGQDYPHIEYIIIDGGSTDATLEIIERYQKQYPHKINLVISEPDYGIYDAMNKGILRAKGDIVGLLNSDDMYFDKNVITKIARVFQEPNIDCCYGDLIYFNQETPDKITRYWRSSEFLSGSFAKGWCPPHPTFFVKREVYTRLGGFDTAYSMGNDVELMMRFLEKHHIKSYYLNEILVKMRLGGASNRALKNIIEQNRNILKAAKRLNIPMSFIKFMGYKIINRLSQFLVKPKDHYAK